MTRRAFGTSGQAVAVIGQGTWLMEQRRAAAVKALQAGIAAGLSHIDTAELYGAGAVEALVGQAIAGRRDEIFLVSKVLPANASFAGTIAACERSLRALRTDRLDCYLLHWRGSIPLAETFRAFAQLQQAGKILSCGVSNFDVADLREAEAVAGAGAIACNQVLYHLQERYIERALIPHCRARGIAVVGYSPFGSGRFPSPRSKGHAVLAELGRRHGLSPQQLALLFLVREEGLFTIPKASAVEHVAANAEVLDRTLSGEELAAIASAFPVRGRRSLPMI